MTSAAEPVGGGTFWRFVGFAFGLLLLLVFVGLSAGAFSVGIRAENVGLVVVLATLACAFLLVGLLACQVCWDGGFVAVAALLAAGLVLAGTSMIFAVPIAMETEQVAQSRVWGLILGGAFLTLVGVALASHLWGRARRPGAWRRVLPVARWAAVALGAQAGLSGVSMIIFLPARALGHSDTSTATEAAAGTAAIAAIQLLPAAILTFHGISSAMGESSGRSRLPPLALLLPLFGLVLLGGALAMRMDPQPAGLMAPLHLAAGLAPGLALTAVAAGAFGLRFPRAAVTWRQLLLAIGISMTGAVGFAAIIEGWASGGVLALVLALRHAFTGANSIGQVRDVVVNYEDVLSHREQLAVLLLLAAVVAPIVEEFFKGASARVLMTSATRRSDAFLLGALAGAAFGAVEALLYGLGAFSGDAVVGWWPLMLLRGGASGMHVLGAGLVALGWWEVVQGHGRRWFRYYGAAVLLHATWNGLNVLVGTRLLFPMEGLSDLQLEWLLYAIISPLALGSIAAIALIGVRLRAADPPDDPSPVFEPVLSAAPVSG